MRSLVTIIACSLLLAACGESRLNPFNWFSSDESADQVQATDVPIVQDNRPLVSQVTSLAVDRTPGGAIIRATGLPPTQGWHSVSLVEVSNENGVLTFALQAIAPVGSANISTIRSRELSAAIFVSDLALASVRQIRVVAAQNQRSARR